MKMKTKFKPIFVSPELKKRLEYHKIDMGFSSLNEALLDLLKEKPVDTKEKEEIKKDAAISKIKTLEI